MNAFPTMENVAAGRLNDSIRTLSSVIAVAKLLDVRSMVRFSLNINVRKSKSEFLNVNAKSKSGMV